VLYVDDKLSKHPKILKAGDALGGKAANGSALALALFVDALAYTKEHLTNGFVPAAIVAGSALLADPQAVAAALTRARLWHRVEGGYRFHDFLDWNKSGADVKRERRKWREKKRRQRKANGGDFDQKSDRNRRAREGRKDSAREQKAIPAFSETSPGDMAETILETRARAVPRTTYHVPDRTSTTTPRSGRTGSSYGLSTNRRSRAGMHANENENGQHHADARDVPSALCDGARRDGAGVDDRRVGRSDQVPTGAAALRLSTTARADGGHARDGARARERRAA
jgi:hypothetical protein